jgi:Alpha/beta hydrolase family
VVRHFAVDTIVLIPGMSMAALTWENWILRYSALGYRVIAPEWPVLDDEVDRVRHPAPAGPLTIAGLVDHYYRIIDELERPPIIMGHFVGAVIAQALLDRGMGIAAVAIAPALATDHSDASIDYKNSRRGPLLFIAGSNDDIAQPATVKTTFKLYRKSVAVTGYKEFPRTQCILTQQGWREVAEYALRWALRQAAAHSRETT